MPRFHSSRLNRVLIVLAVAGTFALTAGAEPPKDAELLRDFIHYVRIDRPDLARTYGEALLKRLPAPVGTAEGDGAMKLGDFVALVEQSGEMQRFEETATRGQRIGELEGVASRLLKAYERGKLDQARDPGEIARNIAMLTGAQRQRLLARERLAFAGEYAVPQLLPALLRKGDPALSTEVRQLLSDMGRQSLMPLLAALPSLESVAQETVVAVVADIPYRSSVPFLYDLRQTTNSDAVKRSCERAIKKIDGVCSDRMNVAAQYVDLAERYYAGSSSLLAFPGEEFQILWNYDPSIGLSPVPIDTRVFNDTVAMRLTEKALRLDGADEGALSLWLASNFSREIRTPKGYVNPAYTADRREAMYYAVAAGAGPCQRVLARAIDSRNTALARRALGAIERTAGAAAMISVGAGRSPLLDALRYPNRRVQYDAALALALAQPLSSFDGSERVVPILGSAIRDAGSRFAAVVAARPEQQQSLATLVRGLGYSVLPPGDTLAQVEAAASDAPAVDLLVTDMPAAQTAAIIGQAQSSIRLGATPILALLSQQGLQEIEPGITRPDLVRLVRQGSEPSQQAEAVRQLVDTATGGDISGDEAARYQSRAIDALRDLAMAGSPVLNVVDAAGPLSASLNSSKGPIKLRIAGVLALVGDKRVQGALLDAALAAQDQEMIDLLGRLTASARRFGNMLDDRQVKRLLDLAGTGGDAQATAIAAAIGALNLPNTRLVPLILGQGQAKK